ncbi:hypothetical protein DFH06DRAFT_1119143 [Mycena polygramma]|nr:hypothetical protein DFH06DRAFT_1119143 [Mycena polygramma]
MNLLRFIKQKAVPHYVWCQNHHNHAGIGNEETFPPRKPYVSVQAGTQAETSHANVWDGIHGYRGRDGLSIERRVKTERVQWRGPNLNNVTVRSSFRRRILSRAGKKSESKDSRQRFSISEQIDRSFMFHSFLAPGRFYDREKRIVRAAGNVNNSVQQWLDPKNFSYKTCLAQGREETRILASWSDGGKKESGGCVLRSRSRHKQTQQNQPYKRSSSSRLAFGSSSPHGSNLDATLAAGVSTCQDSTWPTARVSCFKSRSCKPLGVWVVLRLKRLFLFESILLEAQIVSFRFESILFQAQIVLFRFESIFKLLQPQCKPLGDRVVQRLKGHSVSRASSSCFNRSRLKVYSVREHLASTAVLFRFESILLQPQCKPLGDRVVQRLKGYSVSRASCFNRSIAQGSGCPGRFEVEKASVFVPLREHPVSSADRRVSFREHPASSASCKPLGVRAVLRLRRPFSRASSFKRSVGDRAVLRSERRVLLSFYVLPSAHSLFHVESILLQAQIVLVYFERILVVSFLRASCFKRISCKTLGDRVVLRLKSSLGFESILLETQTVKYQILIRLIWKTPPTFAEERDAAHSFNSDKCAGIALAYRLEVVGIKPMG